VNVAVSCQAGAATAGGAPVIPHGAGAWQGLIAGTQQGLKGGELWGRGASIPVTCGTGSGLGSGMDG
jgi:hypothetical protein